MNEIFFGQPRTEDERARAIALVKRQYEKYYNVTPDVPEHLLIATQEGAVIGTIVVEAVKEASAPLTFLYDIPEGSLPGSLSDYSQMSRFTATAPMARAALSCGAAHVALSQGYRWALVEAKPITSQRHSTDGIKMIPVMGATLHLERVKDHVRAYYEALPVPKLYLIDLTDMNRRYLEKLTAVGIKLIVRP